MFIKKLKCTALVLTLAIFFTAGPALAHSSVVWAYAENGQVFVEAFFANGSKIQDSKVVILDENEKIIQEGKTDKEGKFSYKPKSLKKQTIVVVASESHSGTFELSEEDLLAGLTSRGSE